MLVSSLRRRLIAIGLLIVLGALGWSQPRVQPVTRFRQLAVGVYAVAFQYGNYAACSRLLGVLAGTQARAPESDPSLALTMEVSQWVNSLAQGNYSQCLPAAQKLLERPQLQQSPNNKMLVLYVLIEGGRRAGFPHLVDEYLPQAVALADQLNNAEDRFVFYSLAVERELEKNPDLPLQTLIQKHDECWRMLEGFTPGSVTTGGGVASRAARFWIGEWFKRMRSDSFRQQVTPLLDKDVARLLQLAHSGLKGVHGFNPQYEIGSCEVTLDLLAELRGSGRLKIARENLSLLDQQLAVTIPQVQGVQKQLLSWVDSQLAEVQPDLEPLDSSPLRPSVLEGDVSRVEARLHQEWVRLLLAESKNQPDAQQMQEIERRLELARQAQVKAARGQGFLGMDDVRWDSLALLFALRPTGWQQQARELVAESLQLSRAVGFRPGEISALAYQGELLRAQGDLPGALDSLKRATEMSERFINESGGSAAASARIRHRFKRAYDLLTELQLSMGQGADAFATQGRLQQLEVVVQSKGSPRVTDAVTLRGRSGALEQELVSSRASGQDTRPVEQLLARTRGEFYSELTRIRSSNPKYESMLAIRPVNFAQLQKHIPANACLIQYFPSDQALYIFLATSKELKIRKVEVSGHELRQLVARFRQLTVSAGSGAALSDLKPTLFRLHSLLIDPIESDIRQPEVLAFIPTGVLNYLPLGAVARSDQHGGLQYLIERKQVAVILKSSDLDALATPSSRPQGALLGLGNPDGTLPGAAREIREVAGLFPGSRPYLGPEATSQRLSGLKRGVAYIHLATHGVLDSSDPNASYLVVAGAQNRLTVPLICDLRLDGVRLVTLSACQTALGREEGTQGSELTTLASAFSIAGSNSVLASLWSVSDESTRLLMVEFYAALKANQTLAGALQQAEIKLIKDPRFAHPYYWAPFELIGDWR